MTDSDGNKDKWERARDLSVVVGILTFIISGSVIFGIAAGAGVFMRDRVPRKNPLDEDDMKG